MKQYDRSNIGDIITKKSILNGDVRVGSVILRVYGSTVDGEVTECVVSKISRQKITFSVGNDCLTYYLDDFSEDVEEEEKAYVKFYFRQDKSSNNQEAQVTYKVISLTNGVLFTGTKQESISFIERQYVARLDNLRLVKDADLKKISVSFSVCD